MFCRYHRVGDEEFLLTVTAGEAVHLSRAAGPGETERSAVPGWHLRRERTTSQMRWRAYNRASLAERRWAETTLCGRQWIAMTGDEGEDADEPGDEAFAPTCRRCLAIMDKLFPEPVLDDQFALIAQIITATVAEHGYAEMHNVPGDQHAALRKQIRSAVAFSAPWFTACCRSLRSLAICTGQHGASVGGPGFSASDRPLLVSPSPCGSGCWQCRQ